MIPKCLFSSSPLIFKRVLPTAIEDLRKSINKLELRINAVEKSGSKPVAGKPAPAKKEEDDDIDLFGSDEEDEEAGRLRICVDLLDLFSAAKGTN